MERMLFDLYVQEVDAPFIFVSGTIGEETAVSALKLGAQDYLMKDNLKRLIPAVQRELREVAQRQEHSKLQQQVWQLLESRLSADSLEVLHTISTTCSEAILGMAQMGYVDETSDDRSRERFQKIRDQAKKASGLTAQLLAFARRQILQPRNLNLNSLVQETVSLIGNIIGEHVTIKTALDPNLCIINADATQIEQVLTEIPS